MLTFEGGTVRLPRSLSHLVELNCNPGALPVPGGHHWGGTFEGSVLSSLLQSWGHEWCCGGSPGRGDYSRLAGVPTWSGMPMPCTMCLPPRQGVPRPRPACRVPSSLSPGLTDGLHTGSSRLSYPHGFAASVLSLHLSGSWPPYLSSELLQNL